MIRFVSRVESVEETLSATLLQWPHDRQGLQCGQSVIRRVVCRSPRRVLAILFLLVAATVYPLRVLADSTPEQSSTATSGAFTNPSNAHVCDDVSVATATANNQKQTYSG